MRLLLAIPPMVQLNTPYPATAFLVGYLKQKQIPQLEITQADFSLGLALRLFSKEGLARARRQAPSLKAYENTVDAVIRFLQGNDPTLAYRIVGREFLPEGPRFSALTEMERLGQGGLDWAFGALGVQDFAKYLCSLYLNDLADLIKNEIDPRFAYSRYAEKLAASEPSFDPLEQALNAEPTLVDELLDELALEFADREHPDLLGLSVPFPGALYGAFRIAKAMRKRLPKLRCVLGGGYVSTELRDLADPRVFDYFDYVSLDSGELPLEALIEHLQGKRTQNDLVRTLLRQDGKIMRVGEKCPQKECSVSDLGTPALSGLPLSKYLSVLEMLNPMHRLWSDGRWNKLMAAQGCYWRKCSFCDTSLPYIQNFKPCDPKILADRMETLIRETGQSGFHFVDEAAPPAVLKSLAREILDRELSVTWWGNIRFERAFTPALTRLMAQSGCVAVTGGLEAASDRLLKLMNKGVTVDQAAQAMLAFSQAGILVHAYLMYGLPTQTLQETVDALERVRQLFEAGCLQSAYWHRFSVTAHSAIGKKPERYGIELAEPAPVRSSSQKLFARNDLLFIDKTGTDHDAIGPALQKAVYNFMYGLGLDQDVRCWFEFKVPKTKVPRTWCKKLFANRALL